MKLFKELYKNAREYSDVIAFKDSTQMISYGELWRLISANRELLKKRGIGQNVIAYRISNQFDFVIDLLSLLAAECWIIPIPSDAFLSDIPINSEKVILLDNDDFLKNAKMHTNEYFYVNEKQCGIYHMTSGSTGNVKLCKRTAYSLAVEGETYRNLMLLNNSRILSMAPIYHSFALGASCMASIMSTSSLFVMEKFMPRKVIEIINKWRVNILIGVPIMVKALSCTEYKQEPDFSCLSKVLIGTGNVSKHIALNFKKRFGVNISVNYGSTETGGLISRMAEEPNESIGKAMPGVKIKLVSSDGSEALDGEEGEAYIKCEYMMENYMDEESPFDAEGYFPMGDLMKKDSQCNYYIVGRKKNIINIGGKKVNPYEVEKIMHLCPEINDCIVVKGIRNNGDEFVKAIVVSEQRNATYIRQFLSGRLANYKIPSIIEFTNKIERNEVGKHIFNSTMR